MNDLERGQKKARHRSNDDGLNQSLQSFAGETRQTGTMKLTVELSSNFVQGVAASLVASAIYAVVPKLVQLLNVLS